MDSSNYEVGYGKPPELTRFKKGVVSNPKGRPKKKLMPPARYERTLGLLITFKDADGVREMRADEALLRQLINRGIEKGGRWAPLTDRAISICKKLSQPDVPRTKVRITVYPSAGSINQTMLNLKLASKLDPYSPGARMVLEPWLVRAALARLGGRRFSLEEQQIIVNAMRTPRAVQWPDWWSVRTVTRAKGAKVTDRSCRPSPPADAAACPSRARDP